MPTVMMMMILGMKSRDVFVQGPCTALPSQANGRGASGDLAVAPQQKQGVGKTNTAPADSPHGSQFAPLYGPLMERERASSTECLNSHILYPSITVLIFFFSFKLKLALHFISTKCSQQNTFGLFLDS